MLEPVLSFLRTTLDYSLMQQFGLNERVVELNYLVDQDGAVPQKNQNKLVITLINLEHETAQQYFGRRIPTGSNTTGRVDDAIHFNLDLLFTASFDDYSESLKFLSACIAFFQANPSFDQRSAPDMPDSQTYLKFDVEQSSYFETHNLWSAMGARFQPSIIYKARHITVQSDQITTRTPTVESVGSGVTP